MQAITILKYNTYWIKHIDQMKYTTQIHEFKREEKFIEVTGTIWCRVETMQKWN